jgi:hypothetical protein
LLLQFLFTYSCNVISYDDGTSTAGLWYLSAGGTDGACQTEAYDTEDAIVQGARSAIILSMIAGLAAGVMVLFEWLFCEVCCAGCLEGLAYMGAWTLGGAAFMFYGSEFCVDPSVENVSMTEDNVKCDYGGESTYLSGAVFLYFCCGILLCW